MIEVQVWDSANTTQLGVLSRRFDVSWQDTYNGVGLGSVSVFADDPVATTSNLDYFNVVRFVYEGACRFAFRIESRQRTVAAAGGDSSRVWQLSGRGLLDVIGDGVVYPEYGIQRLSGNTRNFFFGSIEGAWYEASDWSSPQGIRYDATTAAQIPWGGDGEGNGPFPTDWPDVAAQWIWCSDPSQIADAGTAWFRSTFSLDSDTNVGIYATADNGMKLYLDGEPIIIDESERFGWRRYGTYTARLAKGNHLLAAEVENDNYSIEQVDPVSTWVRPTYADDSNTPYIGQGFTDAGNQYVDGSGCVNGNCGSDAFDGSTSTYWLSVGNFPNWTSAYEYVEGTFTQQDVNAVEVKVKGGPYTAYVSLKDGGGAWQGSRTVPYGARVVDTDADIKYVRQVTIPADSTAVIPISGSPTADRVRITFRASWDSGLWYYRWRAAVYDVRVSSETTSYVAGGNYAGLLVSVAEMDDSGAPGAKLWRTDTARWEVACGEDRPGWMPHHILKQLVDEAQERNALGPDAITLGFDATTDSNSIAWDMPRVDRGFRVGERVTDVATALAEDSNMDVWMDYAGMVVEAADGRGTDLSTGSTPVVFRPAESVTQYQVDDSRPVATRLLLETEWGWGETADYAGETDYGRVEGQTSLGGAMSVADADGTGQNLLATYATPISDVTLEHTDKAGPKPYVDFNVGDTVLAPDGFTKGSYAAHKVLGVTVTERQDGVVLVKPELEKVD